MDVVDLIETPENVELERPLAGIGSRFIAGLVDVLILAVIYVALYVVLLVGVAADPAEFFGGVVVAIAILLFFIVTWGYFVFFEYRTNGQSPGKKVCKIRVVKEGGTAIGFSDIAIRNLLRVVDGFPTLLFCVVGGFAMFFSKRCQRLGDMAAGTVVVSEQPFDYSARTDKRITAQWESEAGAAVLRATGLTPEEYRVLNNYWMRRGQLTLEARRQLLPSLLYPILQRMGQSLSDGRFETLEAYVELLMRQAWFAENEERARPPQQGEGL